MAVDLNAILEAYDLIPNKIARGKGGFVVVTSKGYKLVVEYKGTLRRLELGERLSKELLDCGYNTIDTYMYNAKGELLTEDVDEKKYVVKNWFEGRECDIFNDEEVGIAVLELARLHMALTRVGERVISTFNKEPIKYVVSEQLGKHLKELKKALGYVKQKKLKNDFELDFVNGARVFINDGEEALKYIEDEYVEYRLYHGDYNHHNIIFNEGFVAITDMQPDYVAPQVWDLYCFMRKVLEKRDYDINVGINMYKIYRETKPISIYEQRILAGCFLFPEKYWKVINAYYNGKKTVISPKLKEKLSMCISQREMKNRFALELLQL